MPSKKRRLAQLEGEKKKIAKTCTPISSFFSGNEQFVSRGLSVNESRFSISIIHIFLPCFFAYLYLQKEDQLCPDWHCRPYP
jgi:hypothetical protein